MDNFQVLFDLEVKLINKIGKISADTREHRHYEIDARQFAEDGMKAHKIKTFRVSRCLSAEWSPALNACKEKWYKLFPDI